MRTFTKSLLALLIVAAGCSGPGNMPPPDAPQPVRVLMVTATHGFRHGPAIDAAKVVMAEMSAQSILDVDITEDINDLNSANLAGYDVLFFALTDFL